MHPLLTRFIIKSMPRGKRKIRAGEKKFSDYTIAKRFWELRISAVTLFKDVLLMLIGIGSAAFGLEGFLVPNGFIDGGVTGISLLISQVTSVSLAVLLIVINAPFILLGYKVVNREFAIKAAISICGLAACVKYVHFPEITHDKLLVALFGGFFLGAGIGISVRGGSVLDGTEVLAIFLSRKLRATIGDLIIVFNVIIFSVAAYLLSIEVALYAMITYLSASKTLDFVVEGIEEYTGVTIISSHNEEIRQMIIDKMGRGVTIYKGKSGFGKRGGTNEVDIIYTVITRLELSTLNTEVEKIDPYSFMVTSSVKDTKGGMIKKRPLKH